VPAAGKEKTQQTERAKLAEEEQSLAKSLSREGGSTPLDIWVEHKTTRQAIFKGSVLVDILQFEPVVFAAGPNDDHWRPTHYAAWITPAYGEGDVRVVDLGEAERIDAAVAAFQAAFRNCQSGNAKVNPIMKLGEKVAEAELKTALADLSKLILRPIRPFMDDANEVILSPDGALWLVPWAALPIEGDRYAIEKWNFRYVTSARDVTLVQNAPSKNPPRIFANPNYNLAVSNMAAALLAVFGGATLPKTPTAKLEEACAAAGRKSQPGDELARRSAAAGRHGARSGCHRAELKALHIHRSQNVF